MPDRSTATRFISGAFAGALVTVGVVLVVVLSTGVNFGSRDIINQAAARDSEALARLVDRMNAARPVSDEDLDTIMEALWLRAREGDVEAARFVFELAERQSDQPAPRAHESAIQPASKGDR